MRPTARRAAGVSDKRCLTVPHSHPPHLSTLSVYFWQSSKCADRKCVFSPNWLIIGGVAAGVLFVVVVLVVVIVLCCCRNSEMPVPSSYY